MPHAHARFADPVEVAPGAVVVPSFHGDDAAPFLIPVNALVLRRPAAVVVLGGMPLPATERLWSHVDPGAVRAVVATRPGAGPAADDVRALTAVCRGATVYGSAGVPVEPGDSIEGLSVTRAPGGDLGVLVPDLRLWWSSSALATPVRHPVVDADDLDDAYWERQVAGWDPACFDGLRAIAPDTVVSGHGMVLRGDRLRTALADRSPPTNGAAAAALELRAALAALAAGRWC
ncbi:MAG TPA: hypothetical protein VGB14_14645 [Acidimicrobiales bacterium]